jgi:hypothetical protein
MRTNQNGKPLYAIRVFALPIAFHFFMKEGGSTIDRLIVVRDYEAKLKSNQIYFMDAPIDQEYVWRTYKKATIDQLQNTSSISQSYNSAIKINIPNGENIMLIVQSLIEKK